MKFFFVFLALAGGSFVNAGYLYNRGINTECLYDEDCITRNSFCKGNKICACKIGYQYDAGSDVCFPKEVDLKCNEDYDCSALQNSRCSNGRCQCKFDYVPSKDRGSCLPSMKLTTFCEEDSQCNSVMNRSYCDPVMRQCVCERGLRQDPYRMLCVQQAKLHNWCHSTQDCETVPENVGRVICRPTQSSLLNECVCADGFVEQNDTCVPGGSSRAVLSLPVVFAFLLVRCLM